MREACFRRALRRISARLSSRYSRGLIRSGGATEMAPSVIVVIVNVTGIVMQMPGSQSILILNESAASESAGRAACVVSSHKVSESG